MGPCINQIVETRNDFLRVTSARVAIARLGADREHPPVMFLFPEETRCHAKLLRASKKCVARLCAQDQQQKMSAKRRAWKPGLAAG